MILVMLLNCWSIAFKKEGDAWKRVDVCTHSCMLRCVSVSLHCCHGFGSKGTGRGLIEWCLIWKQNPVLKRCLENSQSAESTEGCSSLVIKAGLLPSGKASSKQPDSICLHWDLVDNLPVEQIKKEVKEGKLQVEL